MCTKLWHHFFFKFRRWWRYVPPLPQFELRIPGKGWMYKIGARLYKVVRNVYKIMTPFLFWSSKMVGYLPPALPNLNWKTGEGEGVQNSSLVVQNCTPFLFWNSKMVGLGARTLELFELKVEHCWSPNFDKFWKRLIKDRRTLFFLLILTQQRTGTYERARQLIRTELKN